MCGNFLEEDLRRDTALHLKRFSQTIIPDVLALDSQEIGLVSLAHFLKGQCSSSLSRLTGGLG